MSSAKHEEAAGEAPAGGKRKLTPVLMLGVALGLLVIMMIGGTIYHFQSVSAVKAELAAARKEVGREAKTLAKAEEQVAALTRQIPPLKELVAVRTKELAAETLEKEAQQALVKAAQQALADYKLVAGKPATAPAILPAARAAAPAPTAEKTGKDVPPAPTPNPAEKKGTLVRLDCQIAGKSPEEQMETLKRCTQAMDRGGRR